MSLWFHRKGKNGGLDFWTVSFHPLVVPMVGLLAATLAFALAAQPGRAAVLGAAALVIGIVVAVRSSPQGQGLSPSRGRRRGVALAMVGLATLLVAWLAT